MCSVAAPMTGNPSVDVVAGSSSATVLAGKQVAAALVSMASTCTANSGWLG